MNRNTMLNAVISRLDPFRATSDLLKPQTPQHPARQKFREAVRAGELSILAKVFAAEAKALHDCASGNEDAEAQFLELIALKAQAAQRDDARRNAAMSSAGKARARKARIRLGAVLLAASRAVPDPLGEAVTWLYGYDKKHRDYRNERRNLERELARFIEQNAGDFCLNAGIGVLLGQVMVMGALVQTRMDASIADTLENDIRARNQLDFEAAMRRQVESGKLFEIALTAAEASSGTTLYSADTLHAFRWLAGQCAMFLKTRPSGQAFRPHALPPLRFKNVFFGELAGGA